MSGLEDYPPPPARAAHATRTNPPTPQTHSRYAPLTSSTAAFPGELTSTAQSVAAVASQINLIAARREEILKLLSRFRVVFNDEKAPSPSSHDLASPNRCAKGIRACDLIIPEPANY